MEDMTVGISGLETSPLFAGLQRGDLESILGMGQVASFDAGQAIVERGGPGDAMYVLMSGAAQVDVGGRYHDLKPGDFFGEMAVITGRRRTATVKATQPTEALRIPAVRFHSFLLEHPRVAIAMLKSLVERLREVQERLDSWMGAG
jgi:CRP-like cAMP-binding protein